MSDDNAVSTEAEEREPGSTHTSAHELGDITAQRLQGGLRKLAQTVGTEGDGVDYYRFTLSEAREVRLGLKLRQGEAELYLEDAEGNVLARSMAHAGYEAAVRTLLPGTYYVRVEAVGAAASEYEFRYGVLEANASFRPASDSPWHTGLAERMGMPSFGEAGYAFELSETVDGRVSGVLLGTVLAVDPNGEELSYRIVGGNGSGLFALGGASGELSYVGAGEDFEGGAGPYELTVRASDGTHTIDTTVTVTITDAAEAPVFGEGSYAFALTENVDGSVSRVLLGVVEATDPDSDAVRYSLLDGNDSSLFAIEETSGELFYVGAGEDFEGGVTSYEVTVRASDAAHTVDTTVMVTVTDAAEAPAFGEESYAFELAENVDGRVNWISLGAVTATDPDSDAVRYSLLGGNDSSLFAIEETSGELFYVGAGEDFEGGVTSYELTIRASDGTHTVDTTVTVTVTDAAEQPAFGDESYAFELAENADGRANGLSLGRVTATDPDGDEVRYSLTGGNESMLFTVDAASGELYYVGPGEDYESGVTSYELTVRASDAAHTVDTTVTVTVTDEGEAPAFGEESYAFELAENVDGRVNRLSLGSVTATDPDSDTVRYSLLVGNDSSLFGIEETSGELFYVGAGEDFEGGVTSYEVTVRASDAAHTVDTTVTVTVTDEGEAPAFGEESYAFELAENVDGRVNRLSLGTVTATDPDSDTVRYSLLVGNDSSLFGIEETSGELFYVGAGEDFEGGVTSYELTVRASDAAHTVDTTVTVTVTDAAEAPAFGEESYAFELAENVDGRVNRLSLGAVTATDPDSDAVRYSLLDGNDSSLFAIEETSGELFYVGAGEDFESGVTSHELTVRASDAAHTVDTTVTVTVTDAAEAPAFGEESYAFELAENVDGRVNRLSLGAVTATDPDSDGVRYSLLGGNDSSLFAIEETSGELFYVGAGEDFEGGVTSYELTVRASDAAHTVDTTVTVTVTDAAEAPAFGEESYAFELAENVDGRVNRLSLGAVTATDPDSDTVRYSLLDGNDSSLFAIEETSGELFYVGAGEDFEGGVTSYELTVRASDAAHTVDTTVTVTVTDAAEAPAFGEESYAFELAENVDGRVNGLSLGSVTATDPDSDGVRYSLVGGNDSSLFAIEETSGELFYVGAGEDFEGGVTSYELTVRASDAAHTVDTTVTVTVTDEGEAPAFGEESYAFELAENVDGRVNRLSLGTVTATDPDSDGVRYSLVGGNDSSLFAIEETSGELFYVGAGEDFEGGVTSYELTVRASDGTHTIDTTVTVTVTDAAEQPAFGEGSYAFELAENADGRANGLSLGRVLATDPDGDEVRYSLTGGNELFTVDETSGELYYVGPGEDYESGVTSYELTVRASDAAHTVDTTVTVTVTDEGEAPAFGEESYAFELAENVDGRVNWISLGAVTATDPNGDTVRYSLAGGNESRRFAIDADTGEVFYVGSGEDYESGVTSYELTVRASDGTHASDTTVRVALGDVRGHSEPEGGDLPNDRTTTGLVLVDEGAVTGNIEMWWDLDWFAVELVAGRTYQIDFRGQPTGDGTLVDPSLYGVFDGDGRLIPGTTIPDGGTSHNSRLVFTAPGEGTYYIATSGNGTYPSGTGTYELEVRDVRAPVFAESGYRFALSENAEGSVNRQSLGTVTATDPDGGTVRYRLVGGDESRRFAIDPDTGEVFYVGLGEDYESRVTSHELRVRASDGAYSTEVSVTVTVTDAPEAPAFGEESYAFELAENVDGSDEWLSLGVVEAVDPDGDSVHYSLAGGNESGLFAIDETSGELYYVGSGEDFESGVTSHELTVRASDGSYLSEVAVTVAITDAPESPGFGEESYAFALAENADGSVGRVLLGTVLATDPDGDAVRYSLVGGNASGLFVIDPDTGEVFYVGPGEDFESGAGPYELAVRASEGTHAVDTMVTVTVVDDPSDPSDSETATVAQGSSEPAGEDLPAGRQTSGEVLVDAEPVEGTLRSPSDRDWFAVTLAPGRTYAFNVERDTPLGSIGTAPAIRGLRDSNGDPVAGIVSGSEVRYTTDEAAAEAVYYVEIGGAGSAGRSVGTRGSSDEGTGYRLWANDITDDFTAEAGTGTGTVAVGGTATGEVEAPGDRDWFAVTLEANKVYRIDLEGSQTRNGPLWVWDPYLHGVHDEHGVRFAGTANDNYVRGRNNNSRVYFTAEGDGTYYVAAGAAGHWQGTYELSVKEVVDDFAAGTGTQGTVAVGGSTRGRVEPPGDRDWFRVTLEANKTYRVDLEGSGTRAGTLWDPYLYGVHDEHGVLLAGTTSDDGGKWGNSRLYFTVEEAGTYYVAAGGTGATYMEGTYKVSVTDATDDFSAGTGTQGRVAVGGSATGEIETPGDRDWFRVVLEANKTYRVDLEGSSTRAGTLGDPYLRGVHDEHGVLIAGTTNNDGGWNRNSRLYFTAAADGTYHVAAGAAGSSRGPYRLSVMDVTDDFPAGTGTQATVTVGGSVTGVIERRGDIDWFRVTLEEDKLYRIDLEGRDTGAGTLIDPYLRGVYDENGVRLDGTTADSRGTGNNSRVYFTALNEGTYYVAAGADGYLRGTYRLSVTDVTGVILDDIAGGTGTEATVVVGGSETGEINYAEDRDWFRVTLQAGNTYRIDLKGRDTGAGTLWDPYLRGVHDEHGVLIDGTTNNNRIRSAPDSQLYFTAEESGIHYVAAGAYFGGQGTYRLSVTDVTDPTDDFSAGTGRPGTVVVGGTATGEINHPRDRDWFAVTLEANTTYRIDLEGMSTGDGTLYDPYLRGVYDEHGVLLAGTSNNDGGTGLRNSRVTFTAPKDGTYYVAAGGNKAWASHYSEGTYTLSVTDDLTDDFAAEAGTGTGTVAVGGTATGEVETPGDRDWFAVTLEANKVYRIDLQGSQTRNGPLWVWDPYLHGVHDEHGVRFAGTANDNYVRGRNNNSRVYFTAEGDGTYYVAAGAAGHWQGTYELSVKEVVDDFVAGTGTQGTVAVGGSTRGRVEPPGDRDWFRVTLEANKTYRVDLEGSGTRAGTLWDPYLYGVHDEHGVLLAGTTSDDGGKWGNSRLYFTVEEAGTYYVAAGGTGATYMEGTYKVSVTDVTDDFSAGTGTQGRVAVGGSATGEIETPGDRDWFRVVLEANKTYRVDLEGSSTRAGTLGDPYLRGVHDEHGVLIAGTTNNDGGWNRNSRLYFTAAADGTYHVAAGAAGSSRGPYRLSVMDVTDDFPAGTGTQATVTVGGSVTGVIERRGDIDWFRVTLEEDKLYRIDLEGRDTGAGTLIDPYLRGVYDENGVRLDGTTADSRGTGNNSRVYFTALNEGTYYVAAGADGYLRGTYRLSVTDVTGVILDDIAGGTGTEATVVVGGSETGEINYAEDRDWFRVTLQAGNTYRIDLKGRDTGAGTLWDPYLRGVHDEHGVLIDGTTNNNRIRSAPDSQLYFTAEESGIHYVAAGAYFGGQGTYRLSVTDVTDVTDDFSAGIGRPGTVAVGSSATGEINHPRDRDWFEVTLEANTTYRIDLEGMSTGDGTLYDPYLRGVHDEHGVLIDGTTNNDGGTGPRNSRVYFTAPADGTYYVAAGGNKAWASTYSEGTYTLSVEEVTDSM